MNPTILSASALGLTLAAFLAIGQQAGSFELLTDAEATNIQQTLARLQGAEKEQLRLRMYAQLSARAAAAGYVLPPLPPLSRPAAQPTIAEGINQITAQPVPQAEPVIPPMPPVPPEPPIADDRLLNAPEEEIVAAMEAHRAAMHQYMQERRQQQIEQMSNAPDAEASAQARAEEQQAMRERQRVLYIQQMEARRKAMQEQIDKAIGSLNPPHPPYPPYPPYPPVR